MKKTEKIEKQMGDNLEFEVKAQTRKQGGNGTIQQMATESRSKQKKTKNKKCPKRQPSIYIYILNHKIKWSKPSQIP